jgi:hypothetical protein
MIVSTEHWKLLFLLTLLSFSAQVAVLLAALGDVHIEQTEESFWRFTFPVTNPENIVSWNEHGGDRALSLECLVFLLNSSKQVRPIDIDELIKIAIAAHGQ